MTDELRSPAPSRKPTNLIAVYDTAEGRVEIHGLNGGFTVFVGDRLVQKDLSAREFACYMVHCLQSAHYKIGKAAPSDKAAPGYVRGLEDARLILVQAIAACPQVDETAQEWLSGCDNAIRALIAAQSAAPIAAPQDVTQPKDGHKLGQGVPAPAESATPSARCVVVPREPTEEMIDEGVDAYFHLKDAKDEGRRNNNPSIGELLSVAYAAMLAAAPAAQPNAELVIPLELADFLMGCGQLEGRRLGDIGPRNEKFWWRKHIRAAGYRLPYERGDR